MADKSLTLYEEGKGIMVWKLTDEDDEVLATLADDLGAPNYSGEPQPPVGFEGGVGAAPTGTPRRVHRAMLKPADLARLGDKIREALPGAEFQYEGGDFVLTVTVVVNQPGEYILEYPANASANVLGEVEVDKEP